MKKSIAHREAARVTLKLAPVLDVPRGNKIAPLAEIEAAIKRALAFERRRFRKAIAAVIVAAEVERDAPAKIHESDLRFERYQGEVYGAQKARECVRP